MGVSDPYVVKYHVCLETSSFQSVTRSSGPVGAFAAGLCERYRIFAVSIVNIICKLVKVRDVQSVVLTKNIMQDSVPNVICEFSHYFG